MNKRALPGIELIGCNYDVTDKYANADSVRPQAKLFALGLDEFDPNDETNTTFVHLYGTDYYFPDALEVVPLNSATLDTADDKKVTNFTLNMSAGGRIGITEAEPEGLFHGSVKANFKEDYVRNSSYESITKRGLIKAYVLLLPTDAMKAYMTRQASEDINGNMPPSSLVEKYGAFFLRSAVFGGSLNYSQSISKLSVTNNEETSATLHLNYDVFLRTKLSSTVSTDYVHTDDQSDAHFESIGGNPETLNLGYDAWARSLTNEGQFTLVEFDSADSLMPISVLADSALRKKEIEEEILRQLSGEPPLLDTLTVNKNAEQTVFQPGNPTDPIEAQVKTETKWEVIVGAACSVRDSNVTRVAIRVLNVLTNRMRWITSDGQLYNASQYEMVNDLPTETKTRAVAVTGMGFACKDNNVDGITLYYQHLNPVDSHNGTMLNPNVEKHQKGTNPEAHFSPDPGGGLIITGVGLRVSRSNFATMKLWLSPLKNEKKTEKELVELAANNS